METQTEEEKEEKKKNQKFLLHLGISDDKPKV